MKPLVAFIVGMVIYLVLSPIIGAWSFLVAFLVGVLIGSK